MAKKNKQPTAEVVIVPAKPSAKEEVVVRSVNVNGNPAAVVEDTEVVDEEVELLQVDVGDIMKVKQILDETVAETMVSEDLSAHGQAVQLKESHGQGNLKLFLMALACAFAAVAQFALKGAELSSAHRIWLGVCCVSYFAISGILQLLMTFVDKDCIMTILPLTDPHAIKLVVRQGGNKYLDKHGMRVRSQFPRFSEFYTVILEFQGGPPHHVQQTWSVGQFFDVEGYFDEEGVMLEIESLYRRFEAGKFDSLSNDVNININGRGGKKDGKKNN